MSDLMPDSLSRPVKDVPKPGMKFKVWDGFLDTVIEITTALAAQHGCSVAFDYENITMVVHGDSDLEETMELYREICARETTPNDQEDDDLSPEEIEKEIRNIEFDPENDIKWEALKNSSPDDPIVMVAERWGRLMQSRMNEEDSIENVLQGAYDDAVCDQEYSGKAYLQALEILKENWVLGNKLCRAHNWIYARENRPFPIRPPALLILEM